MLSYAFQVLNEQGYKNIATEQFNNQDTNNVEETNDLYL